MAPFRNPFARRPGGASLATDGQLRPTDPASPQPAGQKPSFERIETVGSAVSSSLSVRSSSRRSLKSIDTGDYKMSVVNDSGVYLPPSPTDEKGLWPRQYEPSRISTDTKGSVGEIEAFGISRASFDSYRRSFDVSARSFIDQPARASLDTSRFPAMSRSSLEIRRRPPFESREPPMPEEFEDVGLEDSEGPAVSQPGARRKAFFSKFTAASTSTVATMQETPTTVSRWIGGGLKRVSSSGAQASELTPIEKPTLMVTTNGAPDPEKEEVAQKTPTKA